MSKNSQLHILQKENQRLSEENRYLRKCLGYSSDVDLSEIRNADQRSTINQNSSPEEKISLFSAIFKGREDVFPLRWESKDGRSGYSPACRHEWNRPLCQKPKIKCGNCHHREFKKLTEKELYRHLAGEQFLGIYPMLPDDTCWFLAIDFDKDGWEEDSLAYLQTCEKLNVPASRERSQSGLGCHIWLFFKGRIEALLARQLGTGLMTETMKTRHQLPLSSYDRFFPNQDTLPKGGFGNLIALPLQGNRRKMENSLFIMEDLKPYPDQWAFLSHIVKINRQSVERVISNISNLTGVLDIQAASEEDGKTNNFPWCRAGTREGTPGLFSLPSSDPISVVRSNLVYIEKKNLTSPVINRIKKLAAFQNPEFYRAQSMRMSTYGKPRVIGCAVDLPEYIGLPRGCFDELIGIFTHNGIRHTVKDEFCLQTSIKTSFLGQLDDFQKKAIRALKKHDIGVLSAGTGFGKTVIACKMIAVRKTKTLILVHRQQLLDQWLERLGQFIKPDGYKPGFIIGGKSRLSGNIDVAMLQSMFRRGVVNSEVEDYNFVIVDECHHISAFSFESVLKASRARYVLGLTATTTRKDGHHPIIFMQFGPIRHTVSKKQSTGNAVQLTVKIRKTGLTPPPGEEKNLHISQLYRHLVKSNDRNRQIIEDVNSGLKRGQVPILLTERKEHLASLESVFRNIVKTLIVLRGGMGKKQLSSALEMLKEPFTKGERLILATGKFAGEGFDDPHLDTLYLAMPMAWKGTLQQYVGRLFRHLADKKEIRVFDYVDEQIPVFERMFQKRQKKYQSLGFTIETAGANLSLF
ncbi:DEAD/DEAH box helicase family protein [Candidatus Riflebacteria bacterium]